MQEAGEAQMRRSRCRTLMALAPVLIAALMVL
jgi:hypothetical protein